MILEKADLCILRQKESRKNAFMICKHLNMQMCGGSRDRTMASQSKFIFVTKHTICLNFPQRYEL